MRRRDRHEGAAEGRRGAAVNMKLEVEGKKMAVDFT